MSLLLTACLRQGASDTLQPIAAGLRDGILGRVAGAAVLRLRVTQALSQWADACQCASNVAPNEFDVVIRRSGAASITRAVVVPQGQLFDWRPAATTLALSDSLGTLARRSSLYYSGIGMPTHGDRLVF